MTFNLESCEDGGGGPRRAWLAHGAAGGRLYQDPAKRRTESGQGPPQADAAHAHAIEHPCVARAKPVAVVESWSASEQILEQPEHQPLQHVGTAIELLAGDLPAAEAVLREACDVLQKLGEKGFLSTVAGLLAEALYAQGRYEEADSTLKALKEEWASDDASVNAPRLAVRAKLLAADGWIRLAEETADRALRVVRPMDWLCLQVDALLAHAEVMDAAGRHGDALASAEEALRIAGTKGYEAAAISARALGRAAEPARSARDGEPRA